MNVRIVACGWLFLSAWAFGAGVSNAELDAAVAKYSSELASLHPAPGTGDEDRFQVTDRCFGSIDPSALTLEQIVFLDSKHVIENVRDPKRWRDRINELAKAPGTAGLRASNCLRSTTTRASLSERAESVRAVLNHPALPEALKTNDRCVSELTDLVEIDPAVLRRCGPDFLALGPKLPIDAPDEVVSILYRAILDAAILAVEDPDLREPLRLRLREATANARVRAEKAPDSPDVLERRQKFAALEKSYDSVYARTGILNQPAPELEFTWTSGMSGSVKKLSDLKGKVVALDFWATWCWPCIQSFVQTRELQSRYAASDVAIIGVTSLQGYSMTPKAPRGKQRTETAGNPQLEYDLMKKFINDMDMSWGVAFTKTPVFNLDYGNRYIPYMVLVDATGKVRYRGLHPAHDAAKIQVCIDGLLREANLKVPA